MDRTGRIRQFKSGHLLYSFEYIISMSKSKIKECFYCNKLFENFKRLSAHLRIVHRTKILDYLRVNKLIPKCVVCDREARYRSGRFSKTCCKEHAEQHLKKFNKSKKRRKNLSIKRKTFLLKNKNLVFV